MILDHPLIVFRPVTSDDDQVIATLVREVLCEYGTEGAGFAGQDQELLALSVAYGAVERACYYVVEVDGELVGGGGISPLRGADASICELQKLYFKSKARGDGLGHELLAMLRRRAKHYGYQKMYLETLSTMTQARRLFDSHGFKQLSTPIGDTGHYGCDQWMLLDL